MSILIRGADEVVIEWQKYSVRSKVEYIFRPIQCQSGFHKVSYRSLYKISRLKMLDNGMAKKTLLKFSCFPQGADVPDRAGGESENGVIKRPAGSINA